MKIFKRTLLTILVLLFLGLLFRGWLYRQCFSYKTIGLRTEYSATNKVLTDYIDAKTIDCKPTNIKDIIKLSLKLTSDCLNFKEAKNDNDPNLLIKSQNAHCIGYSAFFSTTCNYLLSKYGFAKNWTSKPLIGQIYFFGINIHRFFNSAFYKDHDFNSIENNLTGEKYVVDPTINDYLNINLVTEKK
jgi:hypothetical protein